MHYISFASRTILLGFLAGFAFGCSDDDDDDGNGNRDGGSTGGRSSGGASTGGATGSGGSKASGGTTGSGGASAGGATGSGGKSSTGGASAGGATASGGAATGGVADSGATDGGGDAAIPIVDSEIFFFLDVANTGEVAQANAASPKLVFQGAKDYAAMMVAHHTAAKQEGAALATQLGITPQSHPLAVLLKTKSDAAVALLDAATSGDIDGLYVLSQVDAHKDVLTILDDVLIPQATRTELRALLTKTRATVATHLEQAETLRDTLGDR